MCVYTDEDLKHDDFIRDSPINLLDDEMVLQNKDSLPQMRFLLKDKDIL